MAQTGLGGPPERPPGAYAGLAAVTVSFGSMALAMAVYPGFSLLGQALSEMGRPGLPSAPLFNGGLVVAGLLGAWFVGYLWEQDLFADPVRRGALVVQVFTMVSMALVGVFPLPSPWHGPVAIGFFASLTFGTLAFGVGDGLAGRHRRGAVLSLWAVGHLAAWVAWFTYAWLPPGITVPELVGSLLLAVWAAWVTRDEVLGGRPIDAPAGRPESEESRPL